jgi:tetratricopeptide (TPR) repeat protein
LGASLVILWYADRLPMPSRPWFLRYGTAGKRFLVAGSLGFGILCAALFFTNVSSRTEASTRAVDALSQETLSGRLALARNSLSMIAAMPALGAGMGSWPVIYPMYAPAPWTGQFMNATHDEYVQFTSETGLIGLLVAAWTIWLILRILWRPVGQSENAGIAAACAGAVAAIGLHSVFDFPMRIPANALLAIICLAMLLRISLQKPKEEKKDHGATISRLGAGLAALILLCAGWAALRQPSKPFPYDLETPTTVTEAVHNIFRYPTFPRSHLQLAKLLYDRQAGAAFRLQETAAVLALEPLNPTARDMRAGDLFLAGDHAKAFDEMRASVADAPAPEFHFYLNGRYLPWLSKDERAAVTVGLTSAVRNGYWPATEVLTNVYETFAMYDDEARLMTYVAGRQTDSSLKSDDLSKAGLAYARAGELDDATRSLELAIAVDPANAAAYKILATEVYAREKDFTRARDTIDRGLASGIPAAPLYAALADVEIQNQDPAAAEKALEQAVALEPFNFELVRRLGLTYLADRKYDNASIWLRKATELNPEFARAYYELGLAEENDYQYFPADKAFVRAIALDSQNSEYATHYVEFKKKVENARNQ